MKLRVGYGLLLVCLLAIAWRAGSSWVPYTGSGPSAATPPSVSEEETITLCATCPPGFELTEQGTCALVSLYDQYQLVDRNNPGVGGLHSALPPIRDGFTPQQIDLGRYLFFDPVLSGSGEMACVSCHQPAKGFSDGRQTSMGNHQQPLKRSAPSLWNVGFNKRFFWDARAASLEEQLQGPLYSAEEMGNTPEKLLVSLNGISAYRRLFEQAFPTYVNEITLEMVYTALAAFESSLVSLNSRYDQYAHGYAEALTPRELAGLNVFRSFVARCAECHTPPLFTNQQVAVIGLAEPQGKPRDRGAEETYKDSTLRGAFKVPTLRNAALTAPYSHAGKFATLQEMISFYTLGRGHEVPVGEKLHIHWHIWEPKLSQQEIDQLAEFIATLTDTTFIPNTPKRLPSGYTITPYP